MVYHSVVKIIYDAKCKHCLNCGSKKNAKNKRQAYCLEWQMFVTLKDKACEKFKI
jgi:hypothetical protein